MATLTETSVTARKLFLWLIIGGIAFLILRFIVILIIAYWQAAHPPPPTPPDTRFNKLPHLRFSSSTPMTTGLSFTLRTVEAALPETTASAKVFSMPKKLPSLLTHERAREYAEKFSFTSDPENISQPYYQFSDTTKPRVFVVDAVNFNFQYKYDYSQTPELFSDLKEINLEKAISEIHTFINSKSLFDESVFEGTTKTEYLSYDISTKTLVPISSKNRAQAVRIDYYRKDLEGYKLVPSTLYKSSTYAIYVPTNDRAFQPPVVDFSYVFWPIAYDDFATYPLRTAAEAWKDLTEGRGYIGSPSTSPSPNIIIRKMYLAYYDGDEPQLYLQPVFVFEGDDNFAAFVPAISSEWLE